MKSSSSPAMFHNRQGIPENDGPPHHDHRGDVDTTKKSPLSTFLHGDIEPNGHRLLLPFLTAKDCLRLSECSKGLINYRYHLSRVKIVPHPSPSPTIKKGLAQLLMNQQPKGLEYLWLTDVSVLDVLDLAPWYWFDGLKTLVVCGARMSLKEEDAAYVERALGRGGLRSLKELHLGSIEIASAHLQKIVSVIGQGVCPGLQSLCLSNLTPRDDDEHAVVEHALGEALRSGHCQHLQELKLTWTRTHFGGLLPIARALQGGACPHLLSFGISHYRLSVEDGQALGTALRSMACPRLEELCLNANGMEDEGRAAIFGALESGSCRNLKVLDLDQCFLEGLATTALGRALFSWNCPHLQRLSLCNGFVHPTGHALMFNAIKLRPLTELRQLLVRDSHMDRDCARALTEAIGIGAFPSLEELDITGNEGIGDVGVACIMMGLGAGGCPKLRKLEMSSVNMASQGGEALGRALSSGRLSLLETLEIKGDDDEEQIGDHAMAEIIKGIRSCPYLTGLNFNGTGMGVEAGQALLQTLQEGSFEYLESLSLSWNPQLGDDILGRGLAEALRQGSFPRLRYLSVESSRLTEEGMDILRDAIGTRSCPRLMRVWCDV